MTVAVDAFELAAMKFRAPACRGRGPLLTVGRRRLSGEASWRSGYAEDCKSLHPGSIPGEASSRPHPRLVCRPAVEIVERGDQLLGSTGVTTGRG